MNLLGTYCRLVCRRSEDCKRVMRKRIAAIGITTSLLLLAIYFSSRNSTAVSPMTTPSAAAIAELDQAQRQANLPQEEEEADSDDPRENDLLDSLSEEVFGETAPSQQSPSQKSQAQTPTADEQDSPDKLADPAQPTDDPSKTEKVSPEKFNSRAQAFFSHMAANSGKPDKSRNGHDAPKHVVASALMLRDLAEKVSDHPELQHDAIPIYRRCAEGSGHPASVRALCYLQLKELAPEQAVEIGPALASDVAEMRDLL